MISYIEGKIISKNEGELIIENNGIGYSLAVSNNTLVSLPLVGEIAHVFTYMVVKEDELSLIGFSDLSEKKLFLNLLDVSGVGPKLALAVLSGLSTSDLVLAIIKEDIKSLSLIKGVGKKTCERIILELKDKLDLPSNATTKTIDLPQTAIDDASYALTSLGMNKNDAYKLARSVADENDTVEEIIQKALKGMGR